MRPALFYPSPFEEAAVLTMDGVGEWRTTCVGHGKGHRIELLKEVRISTFAGLALFGVHILPGLSRQQR